MSTMPPSVAELLALLRELPLLKPHLAERIEELAPNAPARALAGELVTRGWLTPYQADELLQGRGRDLVLGRYVLLEKLGRGGMGQVYKARHLRLDRTDAVKVIRPGLLDDPTTLARFRQEAKAVARLSHSHVVAVYDAGEADGRNFLAMEYVEGIDLGELARRGPFPWSAACLLLRHAALGLRHAHEQGLVHRDIKPSNLLLEAATGRVKVLDFGLAVLGGEDSTGRLTDPGQVMGTPDYIAPEQSASGRTADARADLYSLGCTAYHLLAGHVPFPGGDAVEKLLRHRHEAPQPLGQVRPDLPTELVGIVGRLMAKDPAVRYQTAAELADALHPLAADTLSEPGTGWPGWGLLAVAPQDTTRSAPPLPGLDQTPPPPTDPWTASSRRPDSRRRLILAGLVAALAGVAGLLPFLPSCRTTSPTTPGTEPGDEGTRRWERGELLRPNNLPVFHVAFSPEGRHLAVVCADYEDPTAPGFIRLWDMEKREWSTLGEQPCSVRRCAFTRDGETLVSATGTGRWPFDGALRGEVAVWGVADRKRVRTFATELGASGVASLLLDPEGKWVLLAGPGGLDRLDLATGSKDRLVSAEKNAGYNALALSHDSRLVACGINGGAVQVLEVGTSKEVWRKAPSGRRTYIAGLVFRPGDEELVCVPGDATAYPGLVVFDARTGDRKRTLEHGRIQFFAAALAPDGRTLATGSQHGGVHLWDVERGHYLRELEAEAGGNVWSLCFAPDGRSLAVGRHGQGARAGTVQLWHSPY
jgi:serine/threonine-protein kinase